MSVKMDENYEDKSRLQRDLEEDENILALQTNITKLTAIIKKEIGDKFFDEYINDEDTNEVQVKVEKRDNAENEDVHADAGINNNCNEIKKEVICDDAGNRDGFDKTYILRKILPHSKKNTFVPMKEYSFNTKTILKAMEVQSKENTTQADKYIDMEMRNFYGEFRESEKSFHDELIYKALEKWKDWYEICPRFRNSPLLYKCFICKKGWWRLHPFREHIKNHKEKNLKLTTKQIVHEFHIAAYRKHSSLSIKNVKNNCKCWKCGKTAEFHPLTTETLKYQCAGCKAGFMTCTKLKRHEGICKKYMEMECNKLGLATFKWVTCSLCFQNFINQTEFDVHMTECHSVRSDEPVSIQAKCCSYCHGNCYDLNYHDCPKRIKNIKCKNCCRKFNTKSFKDLHMEFNNGIFNCFLCGKSMKECMAMEHMVEHSKNYMLLYQCVSCKDNVLYTTETTFKNHIKHHERFVDNGQWSTRILMPTKCINGEIVASETILNIPAILSPLLNIDLFKKVLEKATLLALKDLPILSMPVIEHKIMNALPKNTDRRSTIDKITQSTTNDDQQVIIIQNDSPPLCESEDEVQCDDYEQQARLDAEIQKDVEMEKALSKVFRVSNAYQKLLEKETEEPMEEDFYEDDLIILDRRDEVTVISDSDSEEPSVKKVIEECMEENVKDKIASKKMEELTMTNKTVIKKDPDCDNVTAEVGDATEFNKEEELNLNSETIIKEEPDWNDITEVNDEPDLKDTTLKVGDASESEKEEVNLKKKTVIKDEPDWNDITEVNEESDLTKINEQSEMRSGENDEPLDGSAKQKSTELLRNNADNNEEIASDGSKIESESEQNCDGIDNMSTEQNKKLYNCQKCEYKARIYYLYVEHVATSCVSVSLFCSLCSTAFTDLSVYVQHLTQHNYKKLTCPDCQQEFKYLHLLCKHIKTHLRLLVKLPKNDLPDLGRMRDVFECRKCGIKVNLEKLFNHWEAHLVGDKGKESRLVKSIGKKSRRNFEEDITTDIKELKKTMDPKVVEAAVDVLLSKKQHTLKQCVVCRKTFARRNEHKPHIIEHLLSDALKVTANTGHQLRCQICESNLPKIDLYKQHMREHASLPLHRCDLCSKCFSNSGNFTKHRKVHSLFSFVCDACGAKFRAKASLIAHLKMHENNTAKCEECHKTFNTISQLKKHKISTHMTQLRTYPCRVCNKRFSSYREKLDHLWQDHKQRRVIADCPVCKRAYRRTRDMKRHVKNEHLIDLLK